MKRFKLTIEFEATDHRMAEMIEDEIFSGSYDMCQFPRKISRVLAKRKRKRKPNPNPNQLT